jgi:hypothetical protein
VTPHTLVQRIRSSASPSRSPLTRHPSGRGNRLVASVLMATLALPVGCARGRDTSVALVPPELAVPRGAVNVASRGDRGMAAVEYEIKAPYPADAFLAQVADRLSDRGWRVMERDLLNPTIPTSNVRGWTAFIDSRVSPQMVVHQWLGDWRNQQGDVVSYALRYSSVAVDPFGRQPTPSNPDLHVTAFLIPAVQAEAMAARAKELSGK